MGGGIPRGRIRHRGSTGTIRRCAKCRTSAFTLPKMLRAAQPAQSVRSSGGIEIRREREPSNLPTPQCLSALHRRWRRKSGPLITPRRDSIPPNIARCPGAPSRSTPVWTTNPAIDHLLIEQCKEERFVFDDRTAIAAVIWFRLYQFGLGCRSRVSFVGPGIRVHAVF